MRSETVNAMLLNELLKEHRKVEEQDRKVQEQETTIAQLKKQIDVLTATVQKVSQKVELGKARPQTIINYQ